MSRPEWPTAGWVWVRSSPQHRLEGGIVRPLALPWFGAFQNATVVLIPYSFSSLSFAVPIGSIFVPSRQTTMAIVLVTVKVVILTRECVRWRRDRSIFVGRCDVCRFLEQLAPSIVGHQYGAWGNHKVLLMSVTIPKVYLLLDLWCEHTD